MFCQRKPWTPQAAVYVLRKWLLEVGQHHIEVSTRQMPSWLLFLLNFPWTSRMVELEEGLAIVYCTMWFVCTSSIHIPWALNKQVDYPRLTEWSFPEVESGHGIFIRPSRESDANCRANSSPTFSFYRWGN